MIKGKRQWDQVLMVSLVRVALHNRNPDQHICCWGTAGVGGGHGSVGGWWVPEIWRWGMGGWGGGGGEGGWGVYSPVKLAHLGSSNTVMLLKLHV